MVGPRPRFIFLLAFLALVLSAPSYHSATSILDGIVVKVADGDTITVLDSNKEQHRVRIAGIDAWRNANPLAMYQGSGS